MRLVLFNLLFGLMLVMPGQSLAACIEALGCGCGHEAQAAAEQADEPEPCCPRARAAADHSRDGYEEPGEHACCCDADRSDLPRGVEPTLPGFERLEQPSLAEGHAAVTLAGAGTAWPHVAKRAGRLVASRAPPRAPPAMPDEPTRIHVRHCIWRL